MKISPNFMPRQQRRFFVIAALFVIAAGLVLTRYGSIMLGMRTLNAKSAAAVGERGMIFDRNGKVLAMQTRFGHVSVWKPDIDGDGRGELYTTLGRILSIDPEEAGRRIETSNANFLYLQKHITNEKVREIESEIAAGKLRGIKVETVFGRVYPEQELAGSIIGIVGDENRGLEGIEYAYNKELSGSYYNGETVNGDDIVLTIDANVQYLLEDIAGRVREENKAESVILMAMDPRNGEILGSASMPGFNPNSFRETSRETRLHRPVDFTYEPGSVFKIFSLSVLLDHNTVSPAETFFCDGHYERTTNLGERFAIGCLGAHGNVNIRDIIIYSCNAGTGYASDREPMLPFYNGIRSLGFGAKTGADLPGEATGILRPVERWSERSRPTIAMGQEIAVSALQMMQAATAIANDGILVQPHFVRRIAPSGGRPPHRPAVGEPRRVLRAETAREMRSYMQAVTSSIGTGWRANVADLNLAVKTGTAQMIDPATGRFSETDFIASCIALLPAEEPAIVLYLAIIKPRGVDYLGGRIAAPPIREAAEVLVNYLGIPRGKNPQVWHSGEILIPTPQIPTAGEFMPDLSGLSKRALLPLLLDDNLRFELKGDGWVKRQSPPPGTRLEPGAVIILELE
ncbi:MAG: transpeptidase family protein [Spirochaetaceae bacterium]|jgi:cell division protein FtsI (penicillin-binding protein 3)|nr:transpeptidase family protein [Spirochaetaceae bacterium]